MGLVRKATEDSVAAEGATGDLSTILRNAVAAEIERQRLERLEGASRPDADDPDIDR
jgi:hypothetical protein